MSLTPSTQGTTLGVETPINVVRSAMWEIIPGTNGDTYGTVMDFDKRLMSYQDTPTVATAPLYGCGELVRQVYKNVGGTLAYGFTALKPNERSTIYGEGHLGSSAVGPNGETVSTALVTSRGNEKPPYMICAHAEELPNGHWNLYKYYKVQFTPGQFGTQQVEGTNVNFATTTINGVYSKNTNAAINKIRDIQYNIDPNSDSGSLAIENWFTLPYDGYTT